jgi:hypothetical protein
MFQLVVPDEVPVRAEILVEFRPHALSSFRPPRAFGYVIH